MSMTIEVGEVIAALNRLASWNQSAWLTEVGAHQKHVVEQRIRSTKTSPDGKVWPEWRAFTRAKREARGNAEQGLLWDTGNLLGSITYAVDPSHVEIGTDVAYGKYLQDGTPRMVAREFVGWEADQAWLESSLVAHLNALTL